MFQRLREWYLDAKHKSGKKRRELDVTSCFAPLLQWIVHLWGNGNRQLVLVLDATTLGERWTILSISVVVCKCAIPVAWKVLGGHEKGSWRPHWEGLLTHLEGSIPADWQVLVMADRGLYARWLFQVIIDCGWHPFLRINLGVKARAVGEETFDWISRWTPTPGTSWKGTVECFAGKGSPFRHRFFGEREKKREDFAIRQVIGSWQRSLEHFFQWCYTLFWNCQGYVLCLSGRSRTARAHVVGLSCVLMHHHGRKRTVYGTASSKE